MTWIAEPIPDDATWERKYTPAMHMAEQQEADAYFERLVEHCLRLNLPGMTRWQAEVQERDNLGYWAGYYNTETRERVERLFHCAHPIFGPVANGRLSPEEVLQAGIRMGKLAREGHTG